MRERIKSALLAVLVLLSLVQTFLLTYRMPNYDAIVKTPGDYIKAEPLGPEERVENLIFPKQVVLHLGDNKHTILYPDMTFYDYIMSRLQGRSYEGFQSVHIKDEDWTRIREQNEGVELYFDSPVPVKLLQKVLRIAEDAVFQTENISRIVFVATQDEREVRVFFVSENENTVYESTRADITVQDVKQQVEFGRSWTPYKLFNDAFYIPEKPFEMVEVSLPFDVITAEQIQRSLFFDPDVTKKISESDGSEIYTDIKRGLKVDHTQRWINYSDPTVTEGGAELANDVSAAVRFINQHGGWSGKYRFTLPADYMGFKKNKIGVESEVTGSDIRFQQYWGHHPIVGTPQFRFGYMQVKVEQGTVASYERSLIQLSNRSEERKSRTLLAGEALVAKLKALNDWQHIVHIEPVYVPESVKDGKTIRLRPMWQARYKDGRTTLFS
ncbi:YycH family regulatory protein [Paenibacillus sp. 481]|uniref:YycH family regulatory protein n=1 Tax=Paenibacillus sp. 481 TaxID=2835869 RepID=UPI001E2C060B|nr:two-component system activity regulator YycH [Paenibacillus sp. 481]UHA75396.1 hypothetical protein KIK04_10560 [Paenibacillus sp. 481]